ncbi:MAG: hypothetical protein OEV62_04985 [Actinomycetota bacterium]|nr:hypothetical protein [Actinomycetota bacterium]MDH4352836.1 hypothetical protein [Actinomycetota bacterium]MDH5278588.1 hypothetical protein [Actinomycetota bacterium]
MGAMSAPILPGKADQWKAWVAELAGARKAAFEASNARHSLTAHHAWLQTNPDGSQLAIVVHEGPGADSSMQNLVMSDDPFDTWFAREVAEIHGFDLAAPPPPAAEQFL